MGKGYEVKCSVCDYQESFYLGAGYNDKTMAAEAIQDLDEGFYGEEARNFALMFEQGLVEAKRMLYRCRKCGNIETRIKMRIITSGISYSQPYYCSKCNKLLGQVKESDIKKLACPKCGKTIQIVKKFDWDIAPHPEK